jgi:hypothetical protein
MSITSSSVLTEMNISVWTANKIDKSATEIVNISNNATSDASQVRKNLMAGTHQRKAISDFAAGCRLWHNTRTLPWADRGPRLMPTSLFMEYKKEANLRRDTFNQMVDEFVQDYPALVQTAQNYLVGLWNPDDYPDADTVRGKFGFRLVFSPVPESGDFRLDLPAQELDEVKRGYEDSFKDRLADAMKEPWDRLHKVLVNISDRMTDSDGDDGVKVRRFTANDTLITNAQSLCAMLTHLNVTNDPKLEAARRQLEQTMVGTDMETIKDSSVERAAIKGKVDAILNQFEW